MILETTIKSDGFGGWYLELYNPETDERIACESFNDYMAKVVQMGEDSPEELEVKWSADEDVLPSHINDLRGLMNKHQEEQDAGL